MSVFLPYLKAKGHLDSLHLTICCVGSRKLGNSDDYGSMGWDIFAPNLSIYGFDADADACDVANADLQQRNISWMEQHIPLALGNAAGDATLYVTQQPMCSSLYPPNEPFLKRFAGLSELMDLDFTVEIETTTLDAFCQQAEIAEVDFLKIDVQGADLHVLEGAAQLMQRSVLAVQIEVEPSPLYANQPLFADVDQYLRQREFSLFDFSPGRRVRAQSPICSHRHPGQILWADAFYFRDLLRHDIALTHWKTPEKLLKLACLADAMEFPDYALELLTHLTLTAGTDPAYNFTEIILEALGQIPDLVEQGLDALPVVQTLKSYAAQSPAAALVQA